MADSVTDSIVIAADAASVLDVVADVERYPEWQDRVREVAVLERDEDGRPATARMVVDAKLFTATFVLAYAFEPAALRWRLVSGDGLNRNDGAYVLEDLGDGTTRVTYGLNVEPSVPVPGLLKRQASRSIVDAALRGLKRRVEGP